MSLADRLMLAGFGAVAALLGIVLWSLRNGKPHYAWLERLQRMKLGPRQQVAVVIAFLMVIAVMCVIAADTFTKPYGLMK